MQQSPTFSHLVRHKVMSSFAPPGDLGHYSFKSSCFPNCVPGDLIWVTLGQDTHCSGGDLPTAVAPVCISDSC